MVRESLMLSLIWFRLDDFARFSKRVENHLQTIKVVGARDGENVKVDQRVVSNTLHRILGADREVVLGEAKPGSCWCQSGFSFTIIEARRL